MIAWKIRFVTSTTCFIIVGHLARLGSASVHCCPASASSCPLTLPDSLYQCCSYGECDALCCNCDEDCRLKGCAYELVNVTFSDVADPKTRVSSILLCGGDKACRLQFTVERAFNESVMGEAELKLTSTFLRLVSNAFALKYGNTVAEKTATALTFSCDVSSGSQGWLSQEPVFAVLSGAFIYKCCDQDNTTACRVVSAKAFSFRKPIVDSTRFNVGNWSCEGHSGSSDVKEHGEGISLLTLMVLLVFASLFALLLIYDYKKTKILHGGYRLI